jgi:hypothetical protein
MACGGISRALAPFYRRKEAGRWPARVAARSMAFNGSREWRLDGQEETVGRGGDRAVASWHFPTGGERRGVMTAERPPELAWWQQRWKPQEVGDTWSWVGAAVGPGVATASWAEMAV